MINTILLLVLGIFLFFVFGAVLFTFLSSLWTTVGAWAAIFFCVALAWGIISDRKYDKTIAQLRPILKDEEERGEILSPNEYEIFHPGALLSDQYPAPGVYRPIKRP